MKPPPTSDLLVRLVLDAPGEFVLLHTLGADPEAFVTIAVDEHVETMKVASMRFRRFLGHRFYRQHARMPNDQAMHEAVSMLAGHALFDGTTSEVACRIGPKDANGEWAIDLGTDDWRAIEIRCDGWRVVTRPSTLFRRERGMRPLPVPCRGGSIALLRPFVNVATDDEFLLVLVWLLAALRPTGPYTVLVVHGEQGSSKSTLARILRCLSDPNEAPLRSAPREERDIAIAARNGWIICFDNLSDLRDWLSDALCRVATGGGFGTRTLHTNDSEMLFDYVRPIILNGIEEIATRPDLLDRSLLLTLPRISDDQRRPEGAFWADFNALAPKILGALLDVLVQAEGMLPGVHLDRLPRMADFARFGVAVERALGYPDGTFLRAYLGNRGNAHQVTLEANAIAEPLRAFMATRDEWTGSAHELLKALRDANEELVKSKDWPKTPTVLSGHLRRIAPSLRSVGLDIVFNDKARPRRLTLRQDEPVGRRSASDGDDGVPNNGTPRRSDAPDALFAASSDEVIL